MWICHIRQLTRQPKLGMTSILTEADGRLVSLQFMKYLKNHQPVGLNSKVNSMLNYVSVQQGKRKLDLYEDSLVFDHNHEIIVNTTPKSAWGEGGLERNLRRKLY